MTDGSRTSSGAAPGDTAGAETPGEGGGASGDAPNPLRNVTAVIVASVALIALAVAIIALWGKADDPNNETAWARWTFLLAGIEAVAFAGAGFLFGREVNRAAVQTAEKQADKAQQTAQEAQQTAVAETARASAAESTGKAVRDAIAAKAAVAGRRSGGQDLDEDLGPVEAPSDLLELQEFAERAFPD